uniref:Ras-associating domain-containing protein n=1 Tax=Caenorhabditis tropicalis TaxID=1561998 RepID=A0A1I7V503_9PELO
MVMVSEREQLACLVQQWNENRLDLFHLSYPTEELEVEGVMRFYFQDGGEKVLTKCVRVSSTATTRAVVDALSEKFLPDLKMLSNDTYSLWEVHENGDERKLGDEEKPLVVQLQWHKDDREGRFLLKKDKSSPVPLMNLQDADQKNSRFAKKKDKEPKKKHKKEFVSVHVNEGREEAQSQDDIYKQVPFNTFTRTISNPEAVMRKRREKKLETKLKEMTFGGSLKVYGGEIIPTRPYVSILAEINETADRILTAALEKYGLENAKDDYILVEVSNDDDRKSMSDLREVDGRPIPPSECPLFEMTARGNGENGFDSFLAIKKKPSDYQVPSTSVVPSSVTLPMSPLTSLPPPLYNNLPVLIIMNNAGQLSSHRIPLYEGVTEVGSDNQMSNFSQNNICLDGDDIRGRHAAIAFMEGVVTLTPSTRDAYLELTVAKESVPSTP